MKRIILLKCIVFLSFCLCLSVNAGKLHIISATYGVGNIQLDVTHRLKLIYATHGGKFINFKVGKILFDKDPAYGVRKVDSRI